MGSGTTWALGIFAALVFYVLSPGPVAKVIQMIYGSEPPEEYMKPYEIAYLPLGLIVERIKSAEEFYEWYFEVWGVAS
jgi:hypothetical protein